jgi:hypothetical protein
MQRVETSIRMMTLDKRHGTQSEETATGHHGPTARAIGLAAICLGKRANGPQQWTRAGADQEIQRSVPQSRFAHPRRRELQPGGAQAPPALQRMVRARPTMRGIDRRWGVTALTSGGAPSDRAGRAMAAAVAGVEAGCSRGKFRAGHRARCFLHRGSQERAAALPLRSKPLALPTFVSATTGAWRISITSL